MGLRKDEERGRGVGERVTEALAEEPSRPEDLAKTQHALIEQFLQKRVLPLSQICLQDIATDVNRVGHRRTPEQKRQDETDLRETFSFLGNFGPEACLPVSRGLNTAWSPHFSLRFRRCSDPYRVPEYTEYQILQGLAPRDPKTGLPIHQIGLKLSVEISRELEGKTEAVVATALSGNDPEWVLRVVSPLLASLSFIVRIDRVFAIKKLPGPSQDLVSIICIPRAGILQHFQEIKPGEGTIQSKRIWYVPQGPKFQMEPARDYFYEEFPVPTEEFAGLVVAIGQYAKLIEQQGIRAFKPKKG
jgi:hypothetical protein